MIQRQERLNGLHPDLLRFAFDLANEASKILQSDILVTEGYRSKEVQEAYYAQGRKSLTEVNALRKKAGLYEIDAKSNFIVSWALPCESPHQHYAAFDVYLMTKDGKKLESDKNRLANFYDIMKKLALSDKYAQKIELGLFWQKYGQLDPPHVELKNWRTLKKESITACKLGIKPQPDVIDEINDIDNEKKKLGYRALQLVFFILLIIFLIKLLNYGK